MEQLPAVRAPVGGELLTPTTAPPSHPGYACSTPCSRTSLPPQHVPVKCAAFLASFFIDCSLCPAPKTHQEDVSRVLRGEASPGSGREPTGAGSEERGERKHRGFAQRGRAVLGQTLPQEGLKRGGRSKGCRGGQKQGGRVRRALNVLKCPKRAQLVSSSRSRSLRVEERDNSASSPASLARGPSQMSLLYRPAPDLLLTEAEHSWGKCCLPWRAWLPVTATEYSDPTPPPSSQHHGLSL